MVVYFGFVAHGRAGTVVLRGDRWDGCVPDLDVNVRVLLACS